MKFDNHWANLSHVDPGTFTRPAATCQICKDEHQIIQELVEYGAAAAILNPDLSGWHRAKHWGLQMEGSSAGVRTAPQWLHRAWYLAACKHGSSILQMASVKSKTNLPLQKKACCVYFLCTSLHTSSLNRTYSIIYTQNMSRSLTLFAERLLASAIGAGIAEADLKICYCSVLISSETAHWMVLRRPPCPQMSQRHPFERQYV